MDRMDEGRHRQLSVRPDDAGHPMPHRCSHRVFVKGWMTILLVQRSCHLACPGLPWNRTFRLSQSVGHYCWLEFRMGVKLPGRCEEIEKLVWGNFGSKKVAPGCPVSDRWGVGIHFASA